MSDKTRKFVVLVNRNGYWKEIGNVIWNDDNTTGSLYLNQFPERYLIREAKPRPGHTNE